MNNLAEKFDKLTTREKIMLFSVLVVICWGVWDNLFYQSFTASHDQLKSELSTIETQISEQKNSAAQLIASSTIDPNQANKQRLNQVTSKLKQLKSQLGLGKKVFVSPHLMLEVLRDILKQNSGLKLINLKSLPVTSISEADQDHSGVYRHGLSITLNGKYLNTLSYLKSLENLPWKFSWDSINYQVKEYPIAETTLLVYTLSFEENWIGL